MAFGYLHPFWNNKRKFDYLNRRKKVITTGQPDDMFEDG